jgi:hypothetical protein
MNRMAGREKIIPAILFILSGVTLPSDHTALRAGRVVVYHPFTLD